MILPYTHFFSGSAHTVIEQMVRDGIVHNIMPSYYYPDGLENLTGKENVICDSGAHTLQEDGRVPDFDGYHTRYRNFIHNYPHKNKIIWVELDVDQDTDITTERVDESTKDLERLGVKVMRVWHKNRGTKVWEQYCEQYDYLGLSALDGLTTAQLNYLVGYAYKKKVKVHGFGCGRWQLWTKVPFFSVDSTSPLKATAYGQVLNPTGNRTHVSKADYRDQIGGFNKMLKREKGYNNEVVVQNIYKMLEMEKNIRNLWHRRNITNW